MHFYFPGMIVGIIILQTSIVAPTLFKKLEISDFGKAIRALWPKFFILLTILGAATLAALYFGHDASMAEYARLFRGFKSKLRKKTKNLDYL